MLKTVLGIIVLIVVVGILALVIGPCVYYNFIESPDSGQPDMPDIEQATHSFYIENTGGLILSSDYEQYGQFVGSRLFILHNYWEMRGNDFKLVEDNISLDESIFGKITVKKRTKN